METNTSREELVTKTRKPYTITKQRERWTEDEHNRFLEALRLYGRAWQRIEEHIGTKTAVQIRSHAQKFFTKLEKDAQAKGIPVCQALDIEIPPPRPKRKPSTPYPRKPVNGTSSLQVFSAKDAKLVSSASSSHCNQALDLEKEPLTEPNGVEKVSNGKENHDDICSGVSTRPLEAHCASISSVNRYYLPNKAAPQNPSSLRELEPSLRKATADNGTSKTSNTDNSCYSQDNADKDLPQLNISRGDNGVNNGLSPADNMNRIQNYPWLFPMHVLNGSVGTCPQNPPGMGFQDSMFRPIGEVHGHSSGLFTIPATSATTSQHPDNMSSSSHQAFPTFHPAFVPACHTQDDYRSFLQISSTFSNLIVSTLLQNPAAHAAASFAASFWPYANVGSSNDSSTSTIQTDKAFSPRQMNSPPSLTAIAAATVAAATAWWAAHGLLPICAPFTCSPISAAAVPPSSSTQIVMHETDKKELSTEIPQQGETQVLASKSPASSSDDSEENGRSKQNTKSNIDDHKEEVITVQEDVHDSNTTQKKKLVDRSSCGSNTPSGSDIETDALEKVEKDKEEKEDVKENDANQTVTDSTRRNRSNKDNSSDSWKEVSEEGRMAFEALFTRERLPQSFSRMDEKESEKSVQMANNNNEIRDRCSKDVTASMDEDEGGGGGGVVTIGLGPGKSLKTRRTGFKPYKRCSMEAKETRVVTSNGQTDENVSKRIRLEGEASTT